MSSKQRVLIIDTGSFETKAGFSGGKKPDLVFPSVIALERGQKDEKPEIIVGKDAIKRVRERKKAVAAGKTYALRYPIQRGMVTDWEQVEHLYRFAFKSLDTEASKQPLLITAQPWMPDNHRDSVTEMVFELFQTKQFYMEYPGALSFYQTQEDNGISVELGAGFSAVVPIVKGKPQYKQALRYPIAGGDLTYNIVKLMGEAGYEMDPMEEYRIAQHVKQNMSYVPMDLDDEIVAWHEKPKDFMQELELPSGEKIMLSKECFLSTEPLFDPTTMGVVATSLAAPASVPGHGGLPYFVLEAIHRAGAAKGGDVEKDLFKNIFVGGNQALLPGLGERLEKEIKQTIKTHPEWKQRANTVKKVSVQVLEDYSAWKGANAWVQAAAKGDAEIKWISKSDYDEHGAAIVRKRCLS